MRFFLFLGCLVSCTTLSTRQAPPYPWTHPSLEDPLLDPASIDLFFKSFLNSPTPSAHDWALYNLGTTWSSRSKAESCRYFEELFKNKKFPLSALLRIRKAQACNVPEAEWQELTSEAFRREAPWLWDLALDSALDANENIHDENHVTWLLEKFKRSDSTEDQLDLLDQAETEAKKIAAPKSDEFIQAITKLRYDTAPSLKPNPSSADLLSVAQDFRRRRMFEKAREYYKKLSQQSPGDVEVRFKSLAGIRQTYKLERKNDESLKVQKDLTEQARKLFLSAKNDPRAAHRYLDAAVLLIRTLWTQHRDAETEPVFEYTLKEMQGYVPVGEILWIKARMYEEKKNWPAALDWLGRALLNYGDNISLREKINWERGWIYRKNKNYKISNDVFDFLVSKSDQTQNDPLRYMYWKGRNLIDLNDRNAALEIFKTMRKQDALSYYALLAQREMKDDFQPLTDQFKLNSQLSTKPQDVLEWLIAVNELEVAQKYLAWTWNQTKHHHYNDIEESILNFARIHASEDVFRRFLLLPQDQRNHLLEAHPGVLFPRPNLDVAETAADKFQISPSLIYAIIRQESAFNPKARSGADAFGMMQLTPETAARIAKQNKLDYTTHDDLLLPEKNIPLGAAYLKELSKEFNGQFIMMVASYNASHEATKGWLNSRLEKDPTEFIEDIPYEETRTYVRLVLRNKIFYDRLILTHAFPFPEGCLNGLQELKL